MENTLTDSNVKIQSLTIVANRWFDRTYGNTYHSVRVYGDNELIGENPYSYGYGDQYIQTAFEILQERGYFPKTGERLKSGIGRDWYEFTEYRREHREQFLIDCVYVTRKKDL